MQLLLFQVIATTRLLREEIPHLDSGLSRTLGELTRLQCCYDSCHVTLRDPFRSFALALAPCRSFASGKGRSPRSRRRRSQPFVGTGLRGPPLGLVSGIYAIWACYVTEWVCFFFGLVSFSGGLPGEGKRTDTILESSPMFTRTHMNQNKFPTLTL